MASIAVLPILIGLAVDYAIQFQARYDEAVAGGLQRNRGGSSTRSPGAVPPSALLVSRPPPASSPCCSRRLRWSGPSACSSWSASRIAFGLALTAGFAALSLRREAGAGAPQAGGVWFCGAERTTEDSPAAKNPCTAAGDPAPASRERILEPSHMLIRDECCGIGLALAVVGWGVGTQIETQSDIRELAPQSIEAVRDLNRLQDATGVSGELDVKVDAPDLTDPATLEWMAAFKHRVLQRQRLHRRPPQLPRRGSLPGAGAVGLRRRRRPAAPGTGAGGAGRTARLRPAPGGADRPEDRPARAHGAAQLRHPGAVARRPAGPDRTGARGDRRAGDPGRPAGRSRTSSSPGCRWSRPRRRATSPPAATG